MNPDRQTLCASTLKYVVKIYHPSLCGIHRGWDGCVNCEFPACDNGLTYTDFCNNQAVSNDSCRDKTNVNSKLYNMKRQIKCQAARLQFLASKLKRLTTENRSLKAKLIQYQNLPTKAKAAMEVATRNAEAKSKNGWRYSPDWILDCLLIRCKSTATYLMLKDNIYLPLPSLSTLCRTIQKLKPEFGFNQHLFTGLSAKLKDLPANERRGVLLFDEMQISKHLDFRAHSAELVGMVNYGELTEDMRRSVEGDHALVVMFQSHLGGWVQTVGCFCSSGTTPSAILSKLLLKAIILLENAGAIVDGLVCDGAATNRAALENFGFCGKLANPCNKMTNPCDDRRNIYFFLMPHICSKQSEQPAEIW
jgi:Transposase protein